MSQTSNVRKFKIGKSGRIAEATHAWKTHPKLPGAARFSYIYRMCVVVSIDGDTATIRLTGLESQPTCTVPARELIQLPPKGQKIYFALDA